MRHPPPYYAGSIPTYGYGLNSLPYLLFQREIGSHYIYNSIQSEIQSHGSLIQRLQNVHTFQGHSGCVNTLCWNTTGSLLASGSDDTQLIVWDYQTRESRLVIDTGHTRNIFCVCFLPHTNDQVLATGAMDCDVRLHYPPYSSNSSKLFRFHNGRVKDVRSTEAAPHIFWSAGEDGLIYQYDLRDLPPTSVPGEEGLTIRPLSDPISFSSSGSLIHLGGSSHRLDGHRLRAMCMSVHPLDPNLMAIGCGDYYIRVYDRRMLRIRRRNDSTLLQTIPLIKFTPKHLQYEGRYNPRLTQHGTSVQYNRNGSELLVSYHNDHIYLYNTSGLTSDSQPLYNYSTNYFRQQKQLQVQEKDLLDYQYRVLGNQCYEKNEFSDAINYYSQGIEVINYYREQASTTVEIKELEALLVPLHNNRAIAYLKRKWQGDAYEALQDTGSILRLDPLNRKAHFRRVKALKELKDTKSMKQSALLFKQTFPEYASQVDSLLDSNDRTTNRRRHSHPTSGSQGQTSRRRVSEHERTSIAEERRSSDDHASESSEEEHDESDVDSVPDINEEDADLVCSHVLRRFIGYCNIQTDIKEAKFFGNSDTHIVSGSDDGRVLIWEKKSAKLVNTFLADEDIVNCVQCHPFDPCLVSSGIENVIRMWLPTEAEPANMTQHELNKIISDNQERMSHTTFRPIDANIMRLFLQQYGGGMDETPQQCAQS